MAVENLVASAYTSPVSAPGLGGVPVIRTASLEATAGASATSTYAFFKVPSNARLRSGSKIYFDDLASTGSPTVDIGVYAINGNITDDPDALNDGIDVAAAAGSASLVKDIANYGKMVWELAGLSADPKGLIGIKAGIYDAAVNTGGTLTMEIVYTVDA